MNNKYVINQLFLCASNAPCFIWSLGHLFSSPLSRHVYAHQRQEPHIASDETSWQGHKHQQHWVNEKQCRISMPHAGMFQSPQTSWPNGQHWKRLSANMIPLDVFLSFAGNLICSATWRCMLQQYFQNILAKVPRGILCQSKSFINSTLSCS